MKKYKFLGQFAQSNILSCKGSSYTFVPEKLYVESEIINLFVGLYPNRWLEQSIEINENNLSKDVIMSNIEDITIDDETVLKILLLMMKQ